jgi:hypothetical protein
MLSVRNLIAIASFVLVASVVVGAIALTRPPDSGGAGRDSYGTRAHGFRALHDTLNEVGIETARLLHPPTPPDGNATMLLIAPDPTVVGAEPAYLKSLVPWVEQGGRVVVAVIDIEPSGPMAAMSDSKGNPTILDIFGLSGVDLMPRSPADGLIQSRKSTWDQDLKPLEDVLRESWSRTEIPPLEFPVTHTGTFGDNALPISTLSTPGDRIGTMDASDAKPTGTIETTLGKTAVTLAARFARGKGEIVLVSEPRLFSNEFLAKADNSILAAGLLAPEGQRVIIDEFYHGLSVRGNPLYLLTRPGYAALALGLLLTTCTIIWREAVFLGPPLRDEAVGRRDIAEYIRAMGRFFGVGGDESRRFLVTELRSGVLREISTELSLPPEKQDADVIAAVLARRNPQRADTLRKAVQKADTLLESRQSWTEVQTLDVIRSLSSCLSKSV